MKAERGIKYGIRWEIIDRLIEAHPKWKHTNIAGKLGFRPGYLSDLRSGKERVTWSVIVCLAAFFDLDYNSFLVHPTEILNLYPIRDQLDLRSSRKMDREEELRTQYRMLCRRLRRRNRSNNSGMNKASYTLPTYEEFRQRHMEKIVKQYPNNARFIKK